MAVARRLVAQDGAETQILGVDNFKRYIVNHSNDWQMIFGPSSSLTNSVQVLKLAAEFDTADFNSVRFVSYLYNPVGGTIDNSASCTFNVYRVAAPGWTDTLITSFSGAILSNHYWFADVNLSALLPANLDGDTTLMVESVIVRSGETFRDRQYFNHIGVYDSIDRLRKDVDFLDITKVDE